MMDSYINEELKNKIWKSIPYEAKQKLVELYKESEEKRLGSDRKKIAAINNPIHPGQEISILEAKIHYSTIHWTLQAVFGTKNLKKPLEGVDLEKLEKMLDSALEKETPKSLMEWMVSKEFQIGDTIQVIDKNSDHFDKVFEVIHVGEGKSSGERYVKILLDNGDTHIFYLEQVQLYNRELDLKEFLKDYHVGAEFYSPCYGNVTFKEIKGDIVVVFTQNPIKYHSLLLNGHHKYGGYNSECSLFPSREFFEKWGLERPWFCWKDWSDTYGKTKKLITTTRYLENGEMVEKMESYELSDESYEKVMSLIETLKSKKIDNESFS